MSQALRLAILLFDADFGRTLDYVWLAYQLRFGETKHITNFIILVAACGS